MVYWILYLILTETTTVPCNCISEWKSTCANVKPALLVAAVRWLRDSQWTCVCLQSLCMNRNGCQKWTGLIKVCLGNKYIHKLLPLPNQLCRAFRNPLLAIAHLWIPYLRSEGCVKFLFAGEGAPEETRHPERCFADSLPWEGHLLSQLCNPLMSSVFELILAVLLPLYYITECCKFQLCLIVEIASLVYKAWICSSRGVTWDDESVFHNRVSPVPNEERSSGSCAIKDAQCKLVVSMECTQLLARPWELQLDATGLPGTQSWATLCKTGEDTGSLCSLFYAHCLNMGCLVGELLVGWPCEMLWSAVRRSWAVSYCFSICSLVLRGLVFPSPFPVQLLYMSIFLPSKNS